MTAVLRCCCRRCAGGVLYLSVLDFLASHQLHPDEFVLDSEVDLLVDAATYRHPSRVVVTGHRIVRGHPWGA